MRNGFNSSHDKLRQETRLGFVANTSREHKKSRGGGVCHGYNPADPSGAIVRIVMLFRLA
jgi:hypothetical protein